MVTKKIVYLSALATVVAVLIYLSSVPGVSIKTTGDIICKGTLDNPCISYFNITSSVYSLKFYNFTQKLKFTPEVKDYKIYRLSSTGKWTSTKFPINMTKGTNYQFKIIGYKYNPSDIIKWGVQSGDAEIDPYWLSEGISTPTSELGVSEEKDISYSVNIEPPYYFKDVSPTKNNISFTIYKDCSNLTAKNNDVELALDNMNDVLTNITKITINGIEITSQLSKVSNKWQYNISKVAIPCGMAYSIYIEYTKNDNDLSYRILFGENSSVLEVSMNTVMVFTNLNNRWRLPTNTGVLNNYTHPVATTSRSAEYARYVDDDGTYMIANSTTLIFVRSRTTTKCYYNGTEGHGWTSKIMTNTWCNSSASELGSTINWYFYADANFTDAIVQMNENGSWRVESTVPYLDTYQCGGDTINYTQMPSVSIFKKFQENTTMFCGVWDKHAAAVNQTSLVTIMWTFNKTQKTTWANIQDAGGFFYINIGRNATSVTMMPKGAVIQTRMAITNDTRGMSVANIFAESSRQNNIFQNGGTITNYTGGCVNFYSYKGFTVGSGDVYLCPASNNILNVSIQPNINSTRMWLVIQNITNSPFIYVYNDTINTPTSNASLWAEMNNRTANNWRYSNISGSNLGCTNNYNNTAVEGAWTCNATGVWNWTTTGNTMVLLMLDGKQRQNITVTNTSLVSAVTDSTPPIITVNLPVNNTAYTNNIIWFNVTLNEAGSACLVNISNNNNTLTNSSGDWNKLNNTLPVGNYMTRFFCNDTTGNMNSSVYTNFTIVNTCVCPASGNWNIDCISNCSISSACDVKGNDMYFSGGGTITMSANVYKFRNRYISQGCIIVIKQGIEWGMA